jgi:hypothetical protein
MRLLIAHEFEPGRFRRVGVVRMTKAGRIVRMPVKLLGTPWSHFTRSAAQQFAAEPAAQTVSFEFGLQRGRVDRIVERTN